MDNFRCTAAAEKEFSQFAQSSQHETLFLSKINVHTLVDILIDMNGDKVKDYTENKEVLEIMNKIPNKGQLFSKMGPDRVGQPRSNLERIPFTQK